jgi:hypothetical protein
VVLALETAARHGAPQTLGEKMNAKRCLVVVTIAIAFVFAVRAQAQDVNPADKEKAMKYLESTRKNIEEAIKGLSDAQWNFKAAPDRWSIAQCVEHIAATEDKLQGFVIEQVMKAPAAPDRDVVKIDAMVMTMIPDRSQKRQAPEELKPTNRFGGPDASLKHFEESRAKTEDLLKNTPDLRGHALDSPMGVKLDAYEWILFIGGHSERHTKQILEVKADPNFPKM